MAMGVAGPANMQIAASRELAAIRRRLPPLLLLQLTELDSIARGLVDELAASGGQETARLHELLATGSSLVAAVQSATGRLGSLLPQGPSLPPGPSRSDVDAVWERQMGKQQNQVVLRTPVSQPATSLQELAASIGRLPTCTLELLEGKQPAKQPDAATAVLLRCGRTLAAVVQLQQAGGLLPLRVGVLSAAEASAALAASTNNSIGSICSSLWAPSQHAVFQQLSVLAETALLHFLQQEATEQQEAQQEAAHGSALELLLVWLATHSDLFARRSSSSGTLLLADPGAPGGGLLPPLRRPVELSWEELWQAALNPHLRQAEHLEEA